VRASDLSPEQSQTQNEEQNNGNNVKKFVNRISTNPRAVFLAGGGGGGKKKIYNTISKEIDCED
jgi:Flp pilus assembly CpaF family ATPase